jgi:CRISPR system Cascade subunit CasA
MKAQDFAIMRLALAILHTVYSRFNAEDEPYDWLTVDEDTLLVDDDDEYDDYAADVLAAWQNVWAKGKFTAAVSKYLLRYQDKFDLFGESPFFQVTQSEYDSFVPAKKRVATGTGTVAIKQINRLISESGNTPALFAPKTTATKNSVQLGELTRWIVMYQSFTGVTDKTKIETSESFSTPTGWVYRLNPVYAQGNNLFETLMYNYIPDQNDEYQTEKPVWEWNSISEYIAWRKSLVPATNRAALYTLWSRLLHIEWDEQNQPTIFSAGIPMFSNENMFLEPMTTWKQSKKDGREFLSPAMKWKQSIGKAMWRDFSSYVRLRDDATGNQEPGIVSWLRQLDNIDIFKQHELVTLASVALVSDGNATSQAPIAELVDDMTLRASVLFDENGAARWPVRIENAIEMAQLIGRDYWGFITRVAALRNMDDKEFASRETAKYYDRLNVPFNNWLESLQPMEDRDVRVKEWYEELRRIVLSCADQFIQTASPRDYKGIVDEKGQISNVFTVYGLFRGTVAKHLKGEG